jgi:hypothetical protein
MKLNEYKQAIDKLVRQGHGDKEVVFAVDDEGNCFADVNFSPSIVNAKDLSEYMGQAKGKVILIN